MKRILAVLAFIFFVPHADAVLLTTDLTVDSLTVATGGILTSSGFNITANGSGTGGTICYGICDFQQSQSNSTLFEQRHQSFETSGVGSVTFSGTGLLLLSGTGSDANDPFFLHVGSGSLASLAVQSGLVGYWKFDEGNDQPNAADSSRTGANGILTSMDRTADWIAAPTGTTHFYNITVYQKRP